MRTTSSDHYVDVDGEAVSDIANLNPAGEPFEHTVLRTMFTELQGSYCRVDNAFPSSTVKVANFSLARFSDPTGGGVSRNDSLRRKPEVSESQKEYHHFVPQLSSVTLEFDTLCPLAGNRSTEIIDL